MISDLKWTPYDRMHNRARDHGRIDGRFGTPSAFYLKNEFPRSRDVYLLYYMVEFLKRRASRFGPFGVAGPLNMCLHPRYKTYQPQ